MDTSRKTVLEETLYVESRVLEGRVKKKVVTLELVSGDNKPTSSVSLRVGKSASITLDPTSLLVKSSGDECGRFLEVTPGLLYSSTSSKEIELYYLELADGESLLARLCFESKSGLDRWQTKLKNELYKGNSIHKSLQNDMDHEGGDIEVSESLWESFLHINGLSVYTEKEWRRENGRNPTSNSAGMMSSVVIRNSPKICLKMLLQESLSFDSSRDPRIGGALAFSDSLEVIKQLDRCSSLVRIRWSCSSAGMMFPLLASVLWPRESVLLRTWRRNDDGTYVVVYQPVNNTASSPQSSTTRKYEVSPGCVEAQAVFGFTIAPLREEYYASNPLASMDRGRSKPTGSAANSPESLVTLVVKADVGGIAASNNVLSRLSPGLHRKLAIELLKPLMMSLVLMRDRLEQSRFVVMPSMFSQEEEDADDLLDNWIDVSESSAGLRPSVLGKRESFVSSVLHRITPISPAKSVTVTPSTLGPPTPASLSTGAGTPTTIPTVYGQFGCTDRKFWSYPGFDYLKIRGKSYLDDRVKVRAAKPVFELYSSDLVDSQHVLLNVAENLPSVQFCDAPYAFVLNLVFPNNPLQNLVTTWTCPADPTEHTVDDLVKMDCFGAPEKEGDEDADLASLRAFFKNYKEWIQGDEPVDDERRNKKFKLIPRIARGSWVIKQAVGTTPVLLGQKLETRYFRGRTARGCNYFEVDVDITSNSVANNITRLVVNSITSLVVDLAPLIEGQDIDELPERLIGSVRYNHLNLRCGSKFGASGGLEASSDNGNEKEM